MKYYKIDIKKPFLNLNKPYLKIPQYKNNKYDLNLNPNFFNNKNNINKIRSNYTPIRTYNYFKDKKNDIVKTTPIKYQYRKIPFQKVKGFKFKLPNNPINIKHIKKKANTNIDYPIICERNNNTIQNNMNNNYNYNYNNINDTRLETIVHQDDEFINKEESLYNKIEKPFYHQIIETKSSSLGSKYETREESAHFVRSKSSINNIQLIKKEKEKDKNIIKNFSFLKFGKKSNNKLLDLSPNHKLLKYINKAINQLNKIKILIKSQNQTKQNLNIIKTKTKESSPSRNIRIDLSKIGKNLEKYKNIIRIDSNKINISFDKKNKNIFKKLNKTITYDELKSKNKNWNKKLRINRINKIEYGNKYNTINNEEKFRIKNFDTEIKIPKINIYEEDKEINKKNKLKERYKNDNEGESSYYYEDKDKNNSNINTDIANFEFSD